MKRILLLALLTFGFQVYALEVNQEAPCVVLNHINVDNKESEHCIRDHLPSQKYTLVEFFSITCSACLENIPNLANLGKAVESNATTRMVSIDRNEAAVREFINSHRSDLHFEVALDTARDAKNAYGIKWTPTLYVLDQKNKVAYKHEGTLSEQDMKEIQTLVLGH